MDHHVLSNTEVNLTRIDIGLPFVHAEYSFGRKWYGVTDNSSIFNKWSIGIEIPIKKLQIIPKYGMMFIDGQNSRFSTHGIDFVYLTKNLIYIDIGYSGINYYDYSPGITFSVGLYLPKIN